MLTTVMYCNNKHLGSISGNAVIKGSLVLYYIGSMQSVLSLFVLGTSLYTEYYGVHNMYIDGRCGRGQGALSLPAARACPAPARACPAPARACLHASQFLPSGRPPTRSHCPHAA